MRRIVERLVGKARLGLAALALAGIAGCGGPTVPVEGKVRFADGADTKALAGYEIALKSADGKASPVGQIRADGSFTLSTFGADDGALPGQYQVAITPPQSPDPDKPPQKSKVPAKYGDFSTSGLTAEVKGEATKLELVVESAP